MREKLGGPVLGLIVFLVCLGGLWLLKERPWERVVPPTPTPEPTEPPTVLPLRRVEAPEVADDRDVPSLKKAIARSRKYLGKKSDETTHVYGDEVVPIARVRETMERVSEALEKHGLGDAFYAWIRKHCEFYQSTADEVLYTGYFLASLRGARKKSEKYPHPLYRRPRDIVRIDLQKFHFYEDFPGLPRSINARLNKKRRVVPYYTREEIDFEGKLKGKKLEMFWVDSLVDIHSLQVQGSGVVELETGEQVLVGFSDSNGHRFKGVGSYLLEEGMIQLGQTSYQDVQAYLKSNPEKLRQVLSQNARYIFFRKLRGGALGGINVEITPHRTIATDHGVFPPAALALIETEHPVFDEKGELVRWKRFRRLVLNQDTGAAIKTSGRVDLYHGYGAENERLAGSMHQRGKLWFLLLKEPAELGPGD